MSQAGSSAATSIEGHAVQIRPMVPSDRDAMLAFARSLPDHDLLFLRRDITRSEEVGAWLAEIAAGRTTTLIAIDDDGVGGYASVSRSDPRWRRHVAELRVLTAPRLRGQGLGRELTNQAFRVAVELGVEKMVAHMTPDQEVAIGVFFRLGFEHEARLLGEVLDRQGRKHDLLVLSRDVSTYQATRRDRQT